MYVLSANTTLIPLTFCSSKMVSSKDLPFRRTPVDRFKGSPEDQDSGDDSSDKEEVVKSKPSKKTVDRGTLSRGMTF